MLTTEDVTKFLTTMNDENYKESPHTKEVALALAKCPDFRGFVQENLARLATFDFADDTEPAGQAFKAILELAVFAQFVDLGFHLALADIAKEKENAGASV